MSELFLDMDKKRYRFIKERFQIFCLNTVRFYSRFKFTGNLITMLRLLKNTTFSTAFHRVSSSDITKHVRTTLKFKTLNCWMHCVTQKLRKKSCQAQVLEEALEKGPLLTRSIVIKLPIRSHIKASFPVHH